MISETGVSLKDLSAEALLDLGGLKTRCAVQIKCTAHGHIVPCDLCQLEELAGTFCDACGKTLDTPPLPGERDCSSVEQFHSSGRVAFETDALTVLAEREGKRKREKTPKSPAKTEHHERSSVPPAWDGSEEPSKSERAFPDEATDPTDGIDRRVWEDFKRKHMGTYYVVPRRTRPSVSPAPSTKTETWIEAPEDSPAPDHRPVRRYSADSTDFRPATHTHERTRRIVVPKESSDTHDPVRDTCLPVYDPPVVPRPAEIPDTAGEKISLLSVWAALVAAVAGAYVMFQSPWVGGSARSNWYALAFAVSTLIIWFLGVVPLLGKERAHRTMSWWSPAVWAFLAAPWPAVGAYLLCKTGGPGQTLSEGVFVFIIGLFAALVLSYQLASGGIRMTMSAPWPVPLEDEGGTSDDWLWAKIIATVVLNVYLWDFGAAMWKTTAAASAEMPALTAPLESLVNAVNAPKSYANLRNGPEFDQIAKALAVVDALPKPAAGDLEKARKLQRDAVVEINKGTWETAYPLLLLAHKASPAADNIGVTLGLAESLTGRHDDARRHLIEALMINPRNSAGWRTLGNSEIIRGKGSELSIRQASDYYLAAWWFAKDRKRLLQLLARESAENVAMKEAVQRMRKKVSK